MMIVLCDRWIDEVRGIRCELEAGHDGQCTAAVPDSMTPIPARMGFNPLTNGGPGGDAR